MTTPSLIKAARALLSACYSDTGPIAKEIDGVCEAAKALPDDAAVCSRALLIEAADVLAECADDYEYAAEYKGEYLKEKHGDAEFAAAHRAMAARLRQAAGETP